MCVLFVYIVCTPCVHGVYMVCTLCTWCVHGVYLAVQPFHGDQVQGLEGVACGGDEEQADVDPHVVVAAQRAPALQLLLEEVLKPGVDVVDDGLVAAARNRRESRGQQSKHICYFMRA